MSPKNPKAPKSAPVQTSDQLQNFAARGAAAQVAADRAVARVSIGAAERRVVPLDSIAQAPGNPRTSFEPKALRELVDSIRAVGVLQPLLVRRNPNRSEPEEFEIVFGHRRFRAASMAGLRDVPVEIRELSDEAVLEVQLVENVQRAALSPLEEARGYQRLQKAHGLTVDAIAERIGLARSTVYERLRLLELPESVREAVARGTLPASTAGLLVRLADPKAREKAAAAILAGDPVARVGKKTKGEEPEPLSFRAARILIRDEFLLELKGAGFDPEDASLVPLAGPCGPCPKRTGNVAGTAETLGDVSPNVCTDAGCFRAKLEAAWIRRKAAHAAAGGKVLPDSKTKELFSSYSDRIMGGHYVEAEDRPYVDGLGGNATWKTILKSSDVSSVLVRAPSGRIVEVFPAEQAHKAAQKLARAKGGKRPASSGDAALKLEQKRQREASTKRLAVLRGFTEKEVASIEVGDALVALATAFVQELGSDPWNEIAKLEPEPAKGKKLSPWDRRVKAEKDALEALASIDPQTCAAVALPLALASALLAERHGNGKKAKELVDLILETKGLERKKLEGTAGAKPKAAKRAGK